MKFKINLTINEEANKKTSLIHSFSESLKGYFVNKDYGASIEDILIGLTCVNIPQGFEHLFKQHKPFYVDFKVIKNKHTGESIELKKHFHYSVKFNNEEYDEFVNASDEESKKILSKLLLDSLSNFDVLPKKIKDFDKERFKTDLESFLMKLLNME